MADPNWGDEEEAVSSKAPPRLRKRDIVLAEAPRTLCTVILIVIIVQLLALANQTSGTLATSVDVSQQQSYARQLESSKQGGAGGSRFREPTLTRPGASAELAAGAAAAAAAGAPAAAAAAPPTGGLRSPGAAQPPPVPQLPSAAGQYSLPPGAIVLVFGTRPEAIKLLPVIEGLRAGAGAHPVVLINSGQHDALLDETLAGLGQGSSSSSGGGGGGVDLDLNLAASGLGGAAETVGALLGQLGPLFRASPPALVIVQGDTSTAAAAAQAAHLGGIPVAHVEAGLRTFSPATPHPEEFYRTTITAAALLHLAPTHHAANMLAATGATRGRVHVVGNTGVDGTLAHLLALSAPAPDANAPLSALSPALLALLQGTALQARSAFLPRLAGLAAAALGNSLPVQEGGLWALEPPASAIGLPVYAKLCHPYCSAAGSASEGPTCLQGGVAKDYLAAQAAVGQAAGGQEELWIVFTMHRRESFGAPMAGIVAALGELLLAQAGRLHVVWPLHPNPAVGEAMRAGLAAAGVPGHQEGHGGGHAAAAGAAGAAAGAAAGTGAEASAELLRTHFHVVEPLPPRDTAALLLLADAVVTDSGGLQEEAVTLGRHVFVTRATTERPEGLATGLMHLVGLDGGALKKAVSAWALGRCSARYQASARAARTYGDGHAGERSAGIMLAALDATLGAQAVGWVPDGSGSGSGSGSVYAGVAGAVERERGVVERRPVAAQPGLQAAPVGVPQAAGVVLDPEDFRVGGEAEEAGNAAVAAAVAKVAAAAAAAAGGGGGGGSELAAAAPPEPPAAAPSAFQSLAGLFGGSAAPAAEEAEEAAADPAEQQQQQQEVVEGVGAQAESAVEQLDAPASAAPLSQEQQLQQQLLQQQQQLQLQPAPQPVPAPPSNPAAVSSMKRLFGGAASGGRSLLEWPSLFSAGASASTSSTTSSTSSSSLEPLPPGALSTASASYRRLVGASSPVAVPPAHERFARRHQCSAQPPDPGILEEPYADIMATPSAYSLGRDGLQTGPFTWTAIVGTYRRVAFLERMIVALLAQAHPPVEVWVTTFSSPHAAALLAVTRKFSAAKVKFIGGDPQLKYFGRFQLAFQAPSTHVAFFDDDCIPGSHAVANAFHVMYTLHRRYYGLIGMKGHWGNVETPVTHVQHPYHLQWEYRPSVAKAVDLTGGMWFLRRDWLHTMWRDNAFTLETGEDFQLTYTLRKYMGINTFLLPTDEMQPSTWPHSKDYFEVAKGTESTNGRLWDMRPIIFYNMLQRGYTPVMHHETWGEHHTGSNVLVVIDAAADALALRGLLAAVAAAYPHAIRPLLVLTGGPGAGRAEAEVLRALGRPHTPEICCYVGLWDLYLRKLDAQLYRSEDVYAEVLLGMRGVMETTRPALVLVPHRRGSPVARAVVEAAGGLGVPVAGLLLGDWEAPGGKLGEAGLGEAPAVNSGVGWSPGSSEGLEAAAAAAAAEGQEVLAESQGGVFSGALWDAVPGAVSGVLGAASSSTGEHGVLRTAGGSVAGGGRALDPLSPLDAPVTAAYTYVTSSAGLLLRFVEELLCACAKEDSKGVGAYAQCPWATQIKPTPTPQPHASDERP